MTIEDQIRNLLGEGLSPDLEPLTAAELNQRPAGAPTRNAHRWLLVAACLACVAVLGTGLFMLDAADPGRSASSSVSATTASVADTSLPLVSTSPMSSPSLATPPPTEPVESPASTPAEPAMERVFDTEIISFAGTYSMDYQPATLRLGTTGSFTFTLKMTESSFCIQTQDAGNCEWTDDGTELADDPRELDIGETGTGERWARYAIVPPDVDVQFFDQEGPACEMFEFDLAPYSTASLWACEGTRPPAMSWQQWGNSLWDLSLTKGGRTLVATMARPRTTATPMSDPVTTTGYRIGDQAPPVDPAAADPVGPYLLVEDADARVVGFVRTNEYANPSFDGIVLTYDEQGRRNGQLDKDGWHLTTSPEL